MRAFASGLVVCCLLGVSLAAPAQDEPRVLHIELEGVDGVLPPVPLDLRSPFLAPPLVPPCPWPDLESVQGRMAEVAEALEAAEGTAPMALALEEADLRWWAADAILAEAEAEADPTVAAERTARAEALQEEAGRLYGRLRIRFDLDTADRARASYMAGLVGARRSFTAETSQMLLQAVVADAGGEAGRRAAMVLGDHYFQEGQLDTAVEMLELAEESTAPAVADFARYERAWVLNDLGRYREALDELAPLTVADCAGEGPCAAEVARDDLVIFLSTVGFSAEEVETYCASDGVRCPPDAVDRMPR